MAMETSISDLGSRRATSQAIFRTSFHATKKLGGVTFWEQLGTKHAYIGWDFLGWEHHFFFYTLGT